MKRRSSEASLCSLAIVGALAQACSTRDFGGRPNQGNSEPREFTTGAKPCDAPDVVVYGQTTAALGAALGAAAAGRDTNLVRSGKIPGAIVGSPNVCFIEPTDWPGGQLTSEGVSAIDFPHHAFQDEMRSRHNINKTFASWMIFNSANVISGVNPAACNVSAFCDTPRNFLAKIEAELKRYPNLQVIRNAVVKRVEVEAGTDGKRIVSIDVFRRYAKPGMEGKEWSVPLSAQIADWYGAEVSGLFGTELVKLDVRQRGAHRPAVIDASETGDILVLSGASYVQGAERTKNSYGDNIENHGQAFVFPFVQTTGSGINPAVTPPVASTSFYGFGDRDGNGIFSYRKISATQTLQNWNPGNDYPFDYIFLPRNKVDAQKSAWQGGIDIDAIKRAEVHAFGWHQFFKAKSGMKVSIDATALGTTNGLSKFPYFRDTRRSVGIDGFFIRNEDIWSQSGSNKGRQFDDSLGTGLYAADFHSVRNGTAAPAYLNDRVLEIAPFTLPFKAHTNKDFENLLVAGKNMAQTYYVNAATRLQPIEFNSGWGAGAAAEHMWKWGLTSFAVAKNKDGALRDIQTKVALNQPLWMCRQAGFDNTNCVSGDSKTFSFGTKKPGP